MISNCVIMANQTGDSSAGGLGLSEGARAYNCLIAGNKATKIATGTGYGGVTAASALLDACTIIDNAGGRKDGDTTSGMGIRFAHGYLIVRNCIIWNNRDHYSNTVYNLNTPAIGTFENNCTTPTVGSNCETNDPLFIMSGSGFGITYTNGDFNLRAGSPCIDTGTNQTWMVGAVDLDEQGRIFGGIVDMGAYEWVPPLGTMLTIR